MTRKAKEKVGGETTSIKMGERLSDINKKEEEQGTGARGRRATVLEKKTDEWTANGKRNAERRSTLATSVPSTVDENAPAGIKRGRGRPRKYPLANSTATAAINIENIRKAKPIYQKKKIRRVVDGEMYKYVDDQMEALYEQLTYGEADTSRFRPGLKDIERFRKAEKNSNERIQKLEAKGFNKVQKIRFGDYEMNTWYDAPYPEEYLTREGLLYICDRCFKYMTQLYTFQRHRRKCKILHPPGREIYRDGSLSIFEVDGGQQVLYCQNLCLFAKMFLDHKTLYYDVEPFLFYILTEFTADNECQFIGYFSKEKNCGSNYNVSCIVTMPLFQQRGFGYFLIDFSYLLSRVEEKPGTPEKPLSTLGFISYRKYWTQTVVYYLSSLANNIHSLSIQEISQATGMTYDDIILVLEWLHFIHKDENGSYSITIDQELLKKIHVPRENRLLARLECLHWTPPPP